jgi:protein phosphatase
MSGDDLKGTVEIPTRRSNGTPSSGGQCFAAGTDVGCVRTRNEDSYCADGEAGLWVVADGMGGHGSGDVASRIVVDYMVEARRKGKTLVESIRDAHNAVIKAAHSGTGSVQMGSTVAALTTRGAEYEIAWVGDSRVYLCGGELTQLTKDHSLVQERLDRQLITVEQVANDPGRGIITQCLGPANTATLEVGHARRTWRRGEKILLCSDGLHEQIPVPAIAAIIASSQTTEAAVSGLIKAARDAGGQDNITAVLVCAPTNAPRPRGPGFTGRILERLGSRYSSLVLGVALGLLVVLMLAIWLSTG